MGKLPRAELINARVLLLERAVDDVQQSRPFQGRMPATLYS